jgi:hypothetical protein
LLALIIKSAIDSKLDDHEIDLEKEFSKLVNLIIEEIDGQQKDRGFLNTQIERFLIKKVQPTVMPKSEDDQISDRALKAELTRLLQQPAKPKTQGQAVRDIE